MIVKETFEKIWQLALPYLKEGVRKDFALHTKGVVKAMELILKKERGDENVLIPAAILHDVGWSRVPLRLQRSNSRMDQLEALRLHIKHAPPIIRDILTRAGYGRNRIGKVIEIVEAHKFRNPRRHDKQLLIDADTMADAFKEQFYSDVKSYNTTPEKMYTFRKKNVFYTKTAKGLFERELEKRRKEF